MGITTAAATEAQLRYYRFITKQKLNWNFGKDLMHVNPVRLLLQSTANVNFAESEKF